MKTNEINIDTVIQYAIQLSIQNKVFYSDETFVTKKEAINYMTFLSNNKNCKWQVLPVLCPKRNINISDLYTGKYQQEHPIKNKSYNEIIKEHFENELTNND